MRFSLLAALLSAAAVYAQTSVGANAFNNPAGGYNLHAGQSLTLTWTPTTQGTISLLLRSGNPGFLTTDATIAASIPNSGSYTWDIPKNIAEASDYTIEIVSDQDPSVYNYSPPIIIYSSNNSGAGGNVATPGATPTASSMSLSLSSPSPSGSAASKTPGASMSKAGTKSITKMMSPSPTNNAVATITSQAGAERRYGGAVAGLVAAGLGAVAAL